MARGIVIGSAAVAASVGALVYPAGSFLPGFLVGSYGEKTAGPTSTAPAGAKTLTGDPVQTNYGTVQVAIVVENKKITDVQVLQSPVGPNQRYSDYAVPVLKEQVLAAQSANIAGASGASYTSGGFIQSLQSAIAQI
jgi:uncharacterized protein with FMN-binding domain